MIKLTSKPRLVASWLALMALIFAAVHLFLTLLRVEFNASVVHTNLALFNLNAEASIPTWYSQILLFIAAAVLLVVGLGAAAYRKHWLGLSALFVFLSIDEGAAIHELATLPLRDWLAITSGPLFYSWILLYGLLLVLLGVVYARFLWALDTSTRNLILLAGGLFVLGAIGFETIGAQLAAASGEATALYSLSVVAEETLEMLGSVVFIYALLSYLSRQKSTLTIEF